MRPSPRHRSWLKHLPAALLALAGIGLTLSLAAGERNPVRATPGANAAAQQARVIVRYKPGAALLRTHAAQAGTGQALHYAQALAARHGLKLADGRMLAERMQLVLGQGIGSAALAATLAQDPDVEWAVVDGRRHALAAPNDPLYATQSGTTPAAGQWYLRANDSTVKSSINVEPAWAQATGAGVVVAVLDTGITNHPDLNNKILAGYDFVGYSGDASVATANDGDLDDADPHDPGDWITSAENSSGEFQDCGESDSSWHGTQVSGIVGAQTGNAIGMAGIARDAMVLPVRVLGKCGGYDSDIIPGMRWAAGLTVSGVAANAHPAQVLNLSLGSSGDCTAAYAAVMTELTAAGKVVVAAAGNDGLTVGVPANCPSVVAVAGLRHVGTKVGFSNLGPEIVVGAPGGNCVQDLPLECLYPLLSASNTGTTNPNQPTYTTGFEPLTIGTSFSSPIVAGTAALMLSANPALTPAQLTSALKSSARAYPTTGGDIGAPTCHAPDANAQDSECYCTLGTCGAGMADAGAAVTRALSGPFPVVSASTAAPVAGATVTLNASATTALAGNSIASYQWAITSGGGIASFVGGTTGTSATIDTTAAGTVVVMLTVTDNHGHQASLGTSLEVAASALSASIASAPDTLQAGDGATLSVTGLVTDAGRTIASYDWQITAGQGLAGFTGATNASSATLATSGIGTLTVQLTVTDSAGISFSTSKSYSITQAPLTASISATPTAPEVGDSVALSAAGSVVGTNRTIATYLWEITAGGSLASFSGATNGASATLQAGATGSVTIKLTITDSVGQQASTTRTLTITPPTSSGGGGGALAPVWGLGLALAALALRRRPRGG